MTQVHHATLYRADSVTSLVLPTTGESVEIYNLFIERFGIEDARELVRKANTRPATADFQLLVIRTHFITLEAQNALLKILEEPPSSTGFAFVVPHDFVVLATLMSRFRMDDSSRNIPVSVENVAFSDFLAKGYQERIASIEHSAKKQDVDWQRSIKQGLVHFLGSHKTDKYKPLPILEYATRMLLTRGASNKMLLEQIALTLPIR